MTNLRSARIYLRPAAPGDEEIIFRWENDPGMWSFTDDPGPVSMEDILSFLNEPYNDIHTRGQLRLMICLAESDEVAGAVDLYEFNESQGRCGIGINISASQRGRGLASDAVALVISYARDTLHLSQLWCTVPETNHPSIRLFTGQGFTRSGLLRRWLRAPGGTPQDVIFFQLMLD